MATRDEQEQTRQIAAYAQRKRVSGTTRARWQAWPATDQAALFALLQDLQCGENHLKDLLDWLEEIAARDEQTVADILERRELRSARATPGSRYAKLKAVKNGLRKIRYPRLTRLEENVRQAVKALDLARTGQISFPPNFEGDEVTVTLTARNVHELRDGLSRLQQRLDDGRFQRVFDALDEV